MKPAVDRLHVVAAPGAAPEAVLSACPALGRRLMGERGIFDAELSHRWGRPVHCTTEFAAWWRARAGCPSGFALEVLS